LKTTSSDGTREALMTGREVDVSDLNRVDRNALQVEVR